MKSRYSKVLVFAGKSLLWGGGLYAVCLITMYKDDIASVVCNVPSFGTNIKAHAMIPQVDTTIVPNIPHTGIFLSSGLNIKALQVSVDGLMHLVHLLK